MHKPFDVGETIGVFAVCGKQNRIGEFVGPKNYISKIIFPYIDAKKVFFFDYKSVIKEYGDAQEVDIEYKILDECGVPHNKTFIISILIDGKEMGVGKGKNKKEAEQAASKQAMKKLKIQKY